jgi:membrane-associated phospholipid phosphatase
MSPAKKNILGFIGFWAFVAGFILAILAGIFWPQNEPIIVALVILGIIIGLLNITTKEFTALLLATIALVVVGNAFAPLQALRLGEILGDVLGHIATLMAPAAVIAAIKALWAVGKPGD